MFLWQWVLYKPAKLTRYFTIGHINLSVLLQFSLLLLLKVVVSHCWFWAAYSQFIKKESKSSRVYYYNLKKIFFVLVRIFKRDMIHATFYLFLILFVIENGEWRKYEITYRRIGLSLLVMFIWGLYFNNIIFFSR